MTMGVPYEVITVDGKRLVCLGLFVPPERAFAVSVPAGILTQDQLFESLGGGLQFPDYFGWNWNAFNECLNDLSWLEEKHVLLYHSDIPFEKGSQDRAIYLDILKKACSESKLRDPIMPPVDLCALFPEIYLPDLE